MSAENAARVAVIGAGAAGIAAARSLRDHGHRASITVFGEESLPPYDRPQLSKEVLSGPADTVPRVLLSEQECRDLGIDLRAGTRIDALDRTEVFQLRTEGVLLAEAEVVVLATGLRSRHLATQAEGLHHLRSWLDAASLRSALARRAGRLLVVGSGFVGMEVAAAAMSRGWQVVAVEARSRLFPGLGPRIGDHVAAMFAERGLDGRPATTVTSVEGAGPYLVQLSDGSQVEADEILVGVGGVPNDALARQVGAAIGDGVLVDAAFRTSVPGLYAIGDVASCPGRWGRTRHEHWRTAQEHGSHCGAVIAGAEIPFDHLPWVWSDVFDHRIEILGSPRAARSSHTLRSNEGGLVDLHLGQEGELLGVTTFDATRFARKARAATRRAARVDLERAAVSGQTAEAVLEAIG
ncbi:NAD(P)/FAD-dependent oxidoreductase [Nocardioides sp. GXZ039]|uniref:NAD(P)/FAD-dependent oxidoreductase n=1 Tax=Nocardioides sp. GXZ039 TaxID=3136018 RepID=UPI0030F3EC21